MGRSLAPLKQIGGPTSHFEPLASLEVINRPISGSQPLASLEEISGPISDSEPLASLEAFLDSFKLNILVTRLLTSSFLQNWLKPSRRLQFIDKFIAKHIERGFDGFQWNQISQLINEVKLQRKVSKIGMNSLRKASQRLEIPYWKAKYYFKNVPRYMIRRYSLGSFIPKLTGIPE